MKRIFYFLLISLNIFVNNSFAGMDDWSAAWEPIKKCGAYIANNSGKIITSFKEHGGKFAGVGDKLGKVFSDMAAAATAITIARFGKDIVVEVKERVSPGHDRQLKLATQEMNKCLFVHKMSERGIDNMPIACKNSLSKYEELAGPIAMLQLKAAFEKNS